MRTHTSPTIQRYAGLQLTYVKFSIIGTRREKLGAVASIHCKVWGIRPSAKNINVLILKLRYRILPSLIVLVSLTVGRSTALSHFDEKAMKNARRRRKHCVLAVVRRSQKISPRRRPLPGGAERPKFNCWRWSLPSPTDPVW